jgi:hypothetical protein
VVEHLDEPVQRGDELLQVDRGGRDLPDGDQARVVTPGAQQDDQHQRKLEGQVEPHEQQVPQRHGVALGLSRLGGVVVEAGLPDVVEAQRLDGARPLDGLGDRRVDGAVGRRLGDVAGRRVAQVVAHREEQDDAGHDERQRE